MRFALRQPPYPIDRWARVALATAIDQAIAEKPNAGERIYIRSSWGGACGSRRHYPSTGLWGAPKSLWRLWCDVAIFVQDPIMVPPFTGEAFAKLYGLTGRATRAGCSGARS